MSKDLIQPTTTVEALNKTLETPPLDPVVLAIANDYLAGHDISKLSEEYGITEDRVTSVIEKKEVKSYIDSVFATQGYLNRIKRVALINRVIDPKNTGPAVAIQVNNYDKLMKDLMND